MKTHTLILTTLLLLTENLFGQTFTRITTGAIVNDGGFSYGAAWGDYDGDDYLDLFVANGGDEENFLYHNEGDGTFTKVTSGDIVNDLEWSHSGAWGDYDNDGDLDLFVGNEGGDDAVEINSLYANNGDGTFTKITSGAIVEDLGAFSNGSWGDYDNDGFIDLFVANIGQNYLYHNLGDGAFERTSGVLPSSSGNSLSGAWADYDDDGDLDLFVANGYGDEVNELYQNNGDGTFIRIYSNPIVEVSADSRGGSWGDYDNDGDLDLFVSNGNIEKNSLFRNDGEGTFTQITTGEIVTEDIDSQGAGWADSDNDGDLDLLVTFGIACLLYQNLGDGTFASPSSVVELLDGDIPGMGWGDYDNDGFLDIFSANDGPDNILLRNDGNENSWININAIGQVSNYSAIGTKVRLKAALDGITPSWQRREIAIQTGFQSQNSLNVEFGLGDATIIDSLIIEWPSGIVQDTTNVAVNQFITIEERLIPTMAVSHDTLDFGIGYVGFPDTLELMVSNIGYDTLRITDISISGAGFSAGIDAFTVECGGAHSLPVILTAVAVEPYSGSLTISSNDPDNPSVTIILQGQGLEPPDIAVTQESFSDALLTGASSVQYLTIDNTGTSDLIWEIKLGRLGLETVTFTKEDSADWIQPENQDRITDNVWITRADTRGIFNAAQEDYFRWGVSPKGTEWAAGNTAEVDIESYDNWDAIFGSDNSPFYHLEEPYSMHLIEDDIFFDVVYHGWTRGGDGGGFSYTRSDVRPTWLSVSVDSGVVAAGGSQEVAVNFDATGQDAGGHDAVIILTSNDPDEGALIIPVHLDVTGATDIFTSIDTLDFGQVFVDYTDSLELVVENKGTQDLLITSVVAAPAEYTIAPVFAGVDPDDIELFLVKFTPASVAEYPGTLTFTTNDPDEETFIVPLRGQGLEPPIADVSLDSLTATLAAPDSSIQQVMTISNTGASDLIYELWAVQPEGPDAGSPPLAKAASTDPTDGQMSVSLKDLLEDILEKSRQQGADYALERKVVSNLIAVTGNPVWRLLHTDPDEPYLDLDIRNVYGATTIDEILLKLDVYEPLADVDYFGMPIFIDADRDISTGFNLDDLEEFGWELGIDYLIDIYAEAEPDDSSGTLWRFVESPYGWEFEYVDNLTTMVVDLEANEIILGINAQHLEDFSTINFALGAYSDEDDFVPDQGTGYITFILSPPWISFSPATGVIPAGGQADITVTFSASGLYDGDYFADILIKSNDPVTPQLAVPTRLSISGKPPLAVDQRPGLPMHFALHQNYPNPFNPVSTIRYDLPQGSDVSLIVYDILGREVVRLVDSRREAGYHKTMWDSRNSQGRELPSGVYIARLVTPEYTKSIKMLLLK